MFGLNKITPTKDYCDTAVFHDTTNIDVNIIYDDPDIIKLKKEQQQQQQRIEKNRKKPQKIRKNNKRKKLEFLLKFINCLKR